MGLSRRERGGRGKREGRGGAAALSSGANVLLVAVVVWMELADHSHRVLFRRNATSEVLVVSVGQEGAAAEGAAARAP